MQSKQRGRYGEITAIPGKEQKMIDNLVDGAKNAAKIDEHGAWEFGAEFDDKGRGEAINLDVYDTVKTCSTVNCS